MARTRLATDAHRRLHPLLLALALLLSPLTVVGAVAPTPAAAAPAPASVAARVNFGPASGTATGFVQDVGAPYAATLGRGWVREDSLDGAPVPADLSLNTRTRPTGGTNTATACTTATGTPQGRTFIHMQAPRAAATSTDVKGAWLYDVPDGQYRVEVGYGDPLPGSDPESHTVTVEGTTLVDRDPAGLATTCASNRMRRATGWVRVTDGQLTVDARGGTNTKLAWITIDSVPVDGLVATPGASGVGLDWNDTDGSGSYKVWRSESLPTPTGTDQSGTVLLGSPSDSSWNDATAVPGVRYTYAVGTAATTAPVAGAVVEAVIDAASPQRPALPIAVDFKDRAGVTAAGQVADFGQAYTETRGFGWVDPASGRPLSLVGNGRTRTGVEPPQSTMIHAQYPSTGGAGTAGVQRHGAWQLAVANGAYDVELSLGEASPGTDPTRNLVRLEGTGVADATTVSAQGAAVTGDARFVTVTARGVAVTDGFLTLDAIGGTNTKLTGLKVAPAAPADAPPAAPTGLTATADDGSVMLDWADVTEADLAGYRVYRSTATPVATTGSPVSSTLLPGSGFTDASVSNGTRYHYVVVAVDTAGQASAASSTVSALPDAATATRLPLPARVSFVAAGTTVPADQVKDAGQAFTNARGHGWVSPTSGAPLDLVGNGRFRDVRAGVAVEDRQRGLMHMQADDVTPPFNGVPTEGAWEMAVADGDYDVTVSVGDQPGSATAGCPAPCYDSRHGLRVEGTDAVTGFQATAAREFSVTTVRVQVTDGRLTVVPTGTNTKINYVDVAVAVVDRQAPAAPTGLSATPGDAMVGLAWAPSTSDDVVRQQVYRSTSAPVSTHGTPVADLSATAVAWSDTDVTNGTAYHYSIVALDAAGNASSMSQPASATPADDVAPPAPADLVAAARDGRVELSWSSDPASDAVAFRVHRGTDAGVSTDGDPLATVPVEQGTAHLDEDVENGTTYYYRVTAVDAAGNVSEPTAERSATPVPDPDVTAPAAPTGLSAVAGDARVDLTWTAVGDDDLLGYRVLRSAVAGGRGAVVSGVTPLRTTGFVDRTVVNDATYHYRVEALDTSDNVSPPSDEASATPQDRTPPPVPTGVAAQAGVQQVTVTWDAAPSGADTARYRVYRSEALRPFGPDYEQFGTFTVAQARRFVDANVTAGVPLHYVVTALDAAGNESGPSAVVSATPQEAADTTPPASPTGLRVEVADDDVTLTWTASTSADATGYEVFRADSATGAYTKISPAGLSGTRFVDADRPRGSTSYYRLTALDAAGNASATTAVVTASVAATGLDVTYVFQPDSAPVPAGTTKDTGAAYSSATGRGWVTQASLTSSSHTPLDLSANTRLRTRSGVGEVQNRLIHMQYGDIVPTPTANGDLTPGAWELALAPGRYSVSVSAGDQPGAAKAGCAAPCYDSRHLVRAEGTTVLPAFSATAASEYGTGSATVDVTDGRLTIDAVGGTNTKLNRVTVTSAGPLAPDTTPPAAPGGLLATPGDGAASLSWTAPGDADVASYQVFRAVGATVVPSPDTRIDTSPVTSTSFADTGLVNGTRYAYAVRAVDAAGNVGPASGVAGVVPSAGAAAIDLGIDFADAATSPASGYLLDFGQAFGVRTGAGQGSGLSYGWVVPESSAPVSLVGNGRNRNTASPSAGEPDARRASMMHMQYAGTQAGSVTVTGAWEIAVPNGLYSVKVDVGDAGTATDSTHWIDVENQNAVAAFTPTSATRYATATRTVAVTDGRLTLSPVHGSNTKITYVDVDSVPTAGRPYSDAILPANGAIDVVTNVSPTASNQLPGGAVSPSAVVDGVRLTRVSDGARVPGVGATSGGGDTVSFRPTTALQPATLYRFDVLEGVTDVAGNRFHPFSSVFTTRTDSTNPGTVSAAFDRTDSGAARGKAYTSLVFGPDGRLYASTIFGQIYRYDVASDGTLTNPFEINTVRQHATAAGWEGAPNRTVIGMAFDPASTASDPVLWITDNYAYLGADVPNGTGAVARLSGANLQNYQEVVVNLPRSIKDHETNSLAFHDGKLYFPQGSMNAMGAADGTWKRPENLLSAAVLELDPARLPATLPLDASTPDLVKEASSRRPHAGTYDPYAPGAPLRLYATGVRNAYDLVWHSNGNLYVGTNGSAAGGNVPAVPATLPPSCAKRPDGGYSGPSAPALTNNRQDETDYMFNVKKGRYYGHPNPLRCEYVLNAGNPTGYTGNPLFKVNAYPAGQQADPNYDLAGVHDAGMHASANGTIEYRNASAFGGALKGKLVTARYSANQELVTFDVRDDGSLSTATTGVTGFTGFAQPLDVAEDPTTGNLYVAELPNNFANTAIKLLKPRGGTSTTGRAEPTSRLVFTDVAGGSATASQDVVVRNVGNGPLTITGATLGGADAARFTRGAVPTAPIPAGSSATIPVTFAATTPGPRGAVLTLTTDSPGTPSVSTTLRGLGTLGTGGSNEPSLQWILDTLEIPVDAGDPDPTNNAMPVDDLAIGDEIDAETFTSDPFDNIVRVEPLSLFGPNGATGNVVTVAARDAEPGTGPAEVVTIGQGPNSQNQRVLPAFTGLGTPGLPERFALDFTWHGLGDRVTSTERARNLSWSPGNGRKVRVYPMKNRDGSIEPYTYVVAPEDVPSGVDFQDAAVLVRNVRPAITDGRGEASTDVDELVFSGVKGTTSTTKQVELTNTGTTPLQVSGASLAGTHPGDFNLTGGGPTTLAVGASATYGVSFRPGASVVGVRSATLRIASDDAASPVVEVGLHGLSLNGLEGGNEPPLADVLRTLGRSVDVGWSGLTNNSPATGAQLEGDEVAAPLFAKAGPGPVTMRPVARFSPDEQLPFGWYLPTGTDPERSEVARIDVGQHQTLLPRIVAGGAGGFDPGTAGFGLYVDSRSFNRFSYTQDSLNTGVPHAVRTYPAKDRAGTPIPDTYLVTFEDATNGDYQDYVFEVGNVKVAGAGSTVPVARVDFGPATSPVASGYVRDSGAAFATGGSGWVNQATGAPQSMTTMTRDRGAGGNLDTLLLMQPTAAQLPAGPAAWRYTLPDGTYRVTVGLGDPGFDDSVHRISAEGTPVVAGFTPTAGNRSTTGTAVVEVTDGVLDLSAAGGTNTKIQYVDVDRPTTTVDTSPPTVTARVGGRQAATGVYRDSATVTVVAADDQSGVATTTISVDGGPFTAYTGPVTVTGAGSHSVRARAQNGSGLITTTPLQSFRIVDGGASRGDIDLANLDGVPFADRLVMNRIQTPDPVSPNVVHDTGRLRISNSGPDGLNVTGLDVTGPFAVVGDTTLPAYVPAGGSLDVTVRFTATSNGPGNGLWNGVLTVRSDDVDEPELPVELAGFWQSVSEGNQEPDLVEITRLFGYGTRITSPGQALNQQGLLKPNGDEVISPYWLRADASRPVTVRQLAAFHTQGNTASFFWHPKTSSSTTNVLTHVGEDGQSILPRRNDTARTPGAGSFSPTTAFGMKIDPEWSDPTRNDSQIDRDNGCSPTAQCGHHLRVWPARDRSGAVIADSFLVAMDYAGINYDYNDNVYLVSNIRPETAADPGAPGPVPGAPGLRLEFDAPVPGSLGDASGPGTGFTSTQPNKRDVTPGSDSYRAALLGLEVAGGGRLRVTSSGTATEGTNAGNDNTLVNGLRLPFDGTGERFSVTGRVSAPTLTVLDQGSEQVGVQLGNDQDDYVKVVAIGKTVGGAVVPVVEFAAEQSGTVQTVAQATIASPASVSSLDLALLADPGGRTVRAAYRTGGGAWTVLPTAYAVPASMAGKVFDTRSHAGILVSHKGGTPFTAAYESFGVVPGDVTGSAPAAREALLRVDTGSATTYTDTRGEVWSADTGRFTPSTAPAEGNRADAIAGTDDDPLYATYRGNVGSATPRVIRYSLPTRAATKVDLRLHFAERAGTNAAIGKRVFDIEVEGATVRRGFDVFAAAGAMNTATVLGVNNVTVSGGSLELALRASADYPAISAIEVLCQGPCPADTQAPPAPTGLTASAAQSDVTLDWDDSPATDLLGYRVYRSASATGGFTELTTTPTATSTWTDATAPANTEVFYRVVALDTSENVSDVSATVSATRPVPTQQAVRINAGGPAQNVGGVSWSACTSATACSGWVSGGGFAYGEADTTTGLPNGTNNAIYATEWTGGASGGTPVAVGQRAFGFAVPVVNGPYRVRLHFAELNKTSTGSRVFDVDLEGRRVLPGLDVWSQAGGINRALVRQFPAEVTDGVVNIDFVRRVENAKISAIEILPGADTTAPGAPGSLTATGSASGVGLSWPAVTGDDVAGYRVYRSSSADGTFTELTSAVQSATSYADTTAPTGASFYRVRTVDTSGNTSAPVSASATRPVPLPAQVTGVTATGSPSGIALGWSATTGASGYRVYRSTSATGPWTQVTSTPVTGTSYADADAPAGARSYYQVTALNGSGEGPRSATADATRPVPAPGQVTGVTASGGQSGVTLGWTATPGATGYRVYRASSAGGSWTLLTATPLTGTSYLDAAAPAGATSFYQVAAVNAAGEGARSSTASAARPAAPSQPTVRINAGGPTVTTGGITWEGCASLTACSGRVSGGFPYRENDTATGIPAGMNNTLFQTEWTGGQNGTGAVPVGQRAFGFTVPVTNGRYTVRLHFTELNRTAANQRLFDVRLEELTVLSSFDVFAQAGGQNRAITRQFRTNVTDGAVSIDFVRRLQNAKVSAIEIIPDASVDTTAPGAVGGASAIATTSGTTVRWTPSTADDLAGYTLYRSTSPGGTFTKVRDGLITGSSYVDTAAPAGAVSYYQVTATDSSGNESVRSLTASAARPLTTRPTVRINTGGAAVTVDGVAWQACSAVGSCSGRVSGGFAYAENDVTTGIGVGLSNAMFTSEWTGGQNGAGAVPAGQRAFGFSVPVTNGRYAVRLHFSELNRTAANQRLFDVRLEGATVLSGFDVWAQAGGINRAISRDFTTTVTDGVVNLDFIRRTQNAKVTAVEIVPIS